MRLSLFYQTQVPKPWTALPLLQAFACAREGPGCAKPRKSRVNRGLVCIRKRSDG
jgi:hypothetical protein